MKRITLIMSVFVLLAMLAGPASALTIGTMTGTGTATVDENGQFITYSFSGTYHFDNIALYLTTSGYQTLAQIFGDKGQYTLSANTDGSLQAGDAKYLDTTIPTGSILWGLYGTNNGTTFYGQSITPAFSGGTSGNVTAVFNSDGFIHWYYAYDTESGGKTSAAALGLPADSYFSGQYVITSTSGDNTINFTITGEFTTVPVPGTVLLLGSGLMGLVIWGRRRLAAKS